LDKVKGWSAENKNLAIGAAAAGGVALLTALFAIVRAKSTSRKSIRKGNKKNSKRDFEDDDAFDAIEDFTPEDLEDLFFEIFADIGFDI
jgi:hypothetical protein